MMNRICSWMRVVALGGLLAVVWPAQAQQENPPERGQQGRTDNPGARRGGNPEQQLNRLAEQLNLTAEQKGKIAPILKEQGEKMRALRDDQNLSREDRAAKLQEIRKEANAKIKPILTEEQARKWEEIQQRQGQRRGQRSGGEPPQRRQSPQP